MPPDIAGQEQLEIFDRLDLSKKSERRIATYVLEEYFGTVMADVGRKQLDFDDEIKGHNLTSQWGQIRRRLESVSEIEASPEYNELIRNLKKTRNRIAHNYDREGDKSWLEYARSEAEDWRKWLIESTENYTQNRKDLDELGLLKHITENSLTRVLESDAPDVPTTGVQEKYDLIMTRASNLDSKFDDLRETEEVTVELINLLEDAHALEQSLRDLEEEVEEIEMRREMKALQEYDVLKDKGAFSS